MEIIYSDVVIKVTSLFVLDDKWKFVRTVHDVKANNAILRSGN